MIAILTYDHPHRKTQDVVQGLSERAPGDVTIVAMPWIERANFTPLIDHRPRVVSSEGPSDLAQNHGFGFVRTDNLVTTLSELDPHLILIAGAGILPTDVVTDWFVVNSHPGILPYSRGLDATKWAILRGDPIGATLHRVDEQTDAGWRIAERRIELGPDDDLDSVFQRVYDAEIQLLLDTPGLIEQHGGIETTLERIDVTGHEPTRRMSNEIQATLSDRLADRLSSLPR